MKNGDINDVKYRRALITVLINKIYLYDDKATIIFNTQDRPVEITEDLLNDIEGSSEDNSAPFLLPEFISGFFMKICYRFSGHL